MNKMMDQLNSKMEEAVALLNQANILFDEGDYQRARTCRKAGQAMMEECLEQQKTIFTEWMAE